MAEDRTKRRLAAILAADVVGYSRLMGQDEAGTLAALKALRTQVIDPKVAEHSGRVFKSIGDGCLAEFPSVVNAVSCAVAIQQAVTERSSDPPIQLRIGINVGDVIVEEGDVFGDGVNVAARIESLAPPGGIALTEMAREHLGTRLKLELTDTGAHSLKNIDRPIRVYLVGDGARGGLSYPKLPDKPSIAVLPFENLSGDREQEYFADGIVEEIITALSRFRQLFVIARNSSFTYKGRAVDVKQVGRELGVRYVLEGSVRKAANRVRITGQLIDISTGAHIWADRFEGDLANIFDLQDQVTASVVGAIAPKLEQAEMERAKRKPTESLDAYDHYLRGLAGVHRWSREGNIEALSHLKHAIELDPDFAPAYGMAARCYSQRIGFGWVVDRKQETAEAERLARRAEELGKDDAVALATAGLALVVVVGEANDGGALIDRALALNPNMAWAWHFSAFAKISLGEPEVAIEHAGRAMRLSPQDPQMYAMQFATAAAHFFAGRLDDALLWAEKAMQQQPNFFVAACIAAASAALAGKVTQTEKAMQRLRQLNPTLRISNLKDTQPFGQPERLTRLAEGLRKAGLPE